MIVIICLAVAVSVILALAMSNSIRKPVEEIRQVAANMAKGQMDMDITYHSADELGEMAEHMRELTGIAETRYPAVRRRWRRELRSRLPPCRNWPLLSRM